MFSARTSKSGHSTSKNVKIPGKNLLMKQILKTKLKEVKNLQKCDLLMLMEPLKILKEETTCTKADLV